MKDISMESTLLSADKKMAQKGPFKQEYMSFYFIIINSLGF